MTMSGAAIKGIYPFPGQWDWLYKHYILSILSGNQRDWLRFSRQWVSVGKEDEVGKAINGEKWPVCLGPREYIGRSILYRQTSDGYI